MTSGLYGERVAGCGCRGVPDGRHVPGCVRNRTTPAPVCEACVLRAATEAGCCGICGTPREGPGEDGGAVPRRPDPAAEAP
ncbi:MAG TPA: hypothetical protein VHA80_07065 [Solirubrobacterales bacterium]|nr:hypothetical protein [Solirubrobacterales bacterium]